MTDQIYLLFQICTLNEFFLHQTFSFTNAVVSIFEALFLLLRYSLEMCTEASVLLIKILICKISKYSGTDKYMGNHHSLD